MISYLPSRIDEFGGAKRIIGDNDLAFTAIESYRASVLRDGNRAGGSVGLERELYGRRVPGSTTQHCHCRQMKRTNIRVASLTNEIEICVRRWVAEVRGEYLTAVGIGSP